MGISLNPGSTLGLALLWVVIGFLPTPLGASPKLVSTDLCADQAVVALADRKDIAGLSRWSVSPAISAVADQARGLPVLASSAEALVMSGADIAVADPYTAAETIRLIKRVGMKVVAVPAAEDYPSVMNALRQASIKIGQAEKGEALIQDLEDRLQGLGPPGGPDSPSALYLRPDGGTAGAGTAVDSALRAAGFRNAADGMGYRGWTRVDLEKLLFDPPALIVASFFERPSTSWQASLGRHPVYRRILAQTPKIEIPGPLWSCGGWPLVEAAERLRDARNELP